MITSEAPAEYGDFETMPIGNQWRPGRAGSLLTDQSPWTGEVIAQIIQADASDVNEAYEAARIAQPQWARALPEQRAAVMRAAASIITARHDEIARWLVRRSGGTRSPRSRSRWE